MDVATRIADYADRTGVAPEHVCDRTWMLEEAGVDPNAVTSKTRFDAHRLFRERIDALIGRYQVSALQVAQVWEEEHVEAERKERRRGNGDGVVRRRRQKIMGYPVTAVLRWMGANKWDEEEALAALTSFGVYDISDITIRLQLTAGRKGERGDPAPITKSQAKTLRQAAK